MELLQEIQERCGFIIQQPVKMSRSKNTIILFSPLF